MTGIGGTGREWCCCIRGNSNRRGAETLMEMADRVIVMDKGRVVEDGPFHILSKQVGGRLRKLIRAGIQE